MQASRPGAASAPTPQPSPRRLRRLNAAPVQLAVDGLSVVAAFALAYWLRFHVYPRYIPGGEPPSPVHYVLVTPLLLVSVLLLFAAFGVYRVRRGALFIDEFFGLVRAWAGAGVAVYALSALYRESNGFTYSRLTLAYWLLLGLIVDTAARYAVRRWDAFRRARGISADRALVIGHGAAADLVITRARMFPDYGFQLCGVISDVLPAGTEFHGVPVVGGTHELREVVLREGVNVVFVALVDVSQDRILHLMDSCEGSGAEFRIVPSMLEIMTTQVAGDTLDGIPLLQLRRGIDIAGPPATTKRIADILVAALGLVVLSPLLLLIALLIRLTSPGPVLLRQERVGMNGRRLLMLKFRTMRTDAEAESGPVWASPEDPRRTRLGAFLRRFSLDELPQFWNVLRGEMSLVGPRAERPVFVREFSARLPHYADRLRVRPGLTGWAQANDLRGQTPVEERLIYDLYYIENWSLAFDLKILLITLFKVFTHKNAY